MTSVPLERLPLGQVYDVSMRALLAKLSEVDNTAEGAVRVIATFDELVTHRASIDALVRMAAGLAACPAGMIGGQRRLVRYDQLAHRLAESEGSPSIERELSVSGEIVGKVWLERPGQSGPLDEIIVERMALAAGQIVERIWARTGAQQGELSAVEILFDPASSTVDRARSARIVGFDRRQLIRVIAVSHEPDPADDAALITGQLRRSGPAAWAMIGPEAFVVAGDGGLEGAFAATRPTCRVAIGPARPIAQARESLDAALIGLRFTTPRAEGHVVACDALGSRALLSFLPVDMIRANGDLQAIRSLSGGPSDLNDLRILEAYCRAGTLRTAGAELHLHHSSVAHRLRHIEEVLGYTLEIPDNQFRAQLAVELWHLTGES
jgi:PucR C-terminal helix-turn-helix domain